MCYSTGMSGLTALSVCSRLCLVANCSALCALMRLVLYCTMPFIATCVDAIGTVFWDRPQRPLSEHVQTCSTLHLTLQSSALSPFSLCTGTPSPDPVSCWGIMLIHQSLSRLRPFLKANSHPH